MDETENTRNSLSNNYKSCWLTDTELILTKATLTRQSQFVRGYTDPHTFEIIVRNKDPNVGIEAVGNGKKNFNISVFASSSLPTSSRRRRSVSTDEGPFMASMNEDTSVGLATKSNLTLTGTVNITLTRANCPNMRSICYVVTPGNGASFKVPGGQALLCNDITPYKNCDGKFCN